MAEIKMNKVISSNIEEVGYDEENRVMRIKFKKGRTYEYSPVTLQGYENFIGAESLGKYFAMHIKNNTAINCTEV